MFWCFLVPICIFMGPPSNKAASGSASIFTYFIFWHMVILHATPLLMTSLNIYYTDIKILAADWKLMVFHGVFYLFANMLGNFDKGHGVYGFLTDWGTDPGIACSLFAFGIPTVIVGFYTCFCHYQWKRRGE